MDELQISGKRFISSRRLAREHGYTADYLGQLIRGGKVAGQKVGRAWYVDAASFDMYLGGEAKVLEPEIPEQRSSDLLVRQSSQDAGEARPFAQEFPAPAPVVVEEPTPAPQIVAGRGPDQSVEEKEVEEVQHIPLRVVKPEAPAGLRYYADEGSSLPEMRSTGKENIPAPVKVFVAPQDRHPSKLPLFALAGAGLAVFIFSAMLSSAVSLNLNVEAGNAASSYYSLQW